MLQLKNTSGCHDARPGGSVSTAWAFALCLCSWWRASFVINKFTAKLVKPGTCWRQSSTAAHSEEDRSMCPKVGMLVVQDSVGNERRLHGENRATGGGNLAKLYSGLHAAASALELSWLVWKGRTAKSPNPEQICPANWTTLQKVSMSNTDFNLNSGFYIELYTTITAIYNVMFVLYFCRAPADLPWVWGGGGGGKQLASTTYILLFEVEFSDICTLFEYLLFCQHFTFTPYILTQISVLSGSYTFRTGLLL